MPTANPVTLSEIYSYIIETDLGQSAPSDTTLAKLLLAFGQAIAQFTPGFSTSGSPYLHRALGNVQGGISDAKIAVIGDSTTYGTTGGSALEGIGPTNTIAELLTSAGFTSALGLSIPQDPANVGADVRWSAGTGWTQPVDTFAWGGLSAMYTGANGAGANTLTFTPSGGYSYDTFDIWYLQRTAAGTVQANIDGGSNTPIVTAGTLAGKKATITATAGTSHVVQLGSVTGASVFIIGVEPSLSTTSKVRVANMGVYGSKTSDWINEAHALNGPLDCIAAYAADHYIINLGVNDAGAGVPTATFLAHLLTLATTCISTGAGVTIMSNVPSQAADGTYLANEALYAQALPAFCQTNGYDFADLFNAWGGVTGYATLQPLGFYGAGPSLLHPSALGYSDIGRFQARSLLNA